MKTSHILMQKDLSFVNTMLPHIKCHIVYLPFLPSDRLPSVLMELVGFVQLGVRVGEGDQDQDRHQASVQWRGEKH